MHMTQTRPRLKFDSRAKNQKLTSIFMSLTLIVGWILFPLLMAITYFSVRHDLSAGFAAILIAFTFAVCLAIGTRQFLKMNTADGFELLIENDVIFFFGLDKKHNKRLRREIALSAVSEADYYHLSEASTMVLHSAGREDLELPLWAFGSEAEKKIVDYIRQRVLVVDIPSAIVI